MKFPSSLRSKWEVLSKSWSTKVVSAGSPESLVLMWATTMFRWPLGWSSIRLQQQCRRSDENIEKTFKIHYICITEKSDSNSEFFFLSCIFKSAFIRSLGCSWYEGIETRGSENKTRLGVEGPLRWAGAALATAPALGGQPWRHGLPAVASGFVQGFSRLT
jgi:hypothetical protein